MDQEREDSMEEMIGSIPHSLRLNDQYPKLGINYSTLLENDQNLLQGIVANNNNDNNNNGAVSNGTNSKRPASLFWSDEDQDHSGISSNKRLHFENTTDGASTSITRTHSSSHNNLQNSTSSFTTLLTNLPQTPPPPLHHHSGAHSVLASIGDGLFRPAYQIPGANWYS